MPQTCCVCHETAASGKSIVFHRFPKDEKKRKIWTDKVNEQYVKAGVAEKENFNKNARICSKHFSESNYDKEKLGRKWLKLDAVPTIFSLKVKQPLKERSSNELALKYNKAGNGQSVSSSRKAASCHVNYKDAGNAQSVVSSSEAGLAFIQHEDAASDHDIVNISSESAPCHVNYKDAGNAQSTASSSEVGLSFIQHEDAASDHDDIIDISSESAPCHVNYKDAGNAQSVASSSEAGLSFIQHVNAASDHDDIVDISSESAPCHVNFKDAGNGQSVASSSEAGLSFIQHEDAASDHDDIDDTSSESDSCDVVKGRKRKYFVGDFDENDVGSPTKMAKYMEAVKLQMAKYKRKMKNLSQDKKRLQKKLKNLSDVITDLQQKSLISESASSVLKLTATGAADALINRMMQGKSRAGYSDELKSFALTLNFYSAKAYNYVREKVGKQNLPCPDTIRKWYSHVSGSPGFTSEAFSGLTMKAEEASKKNGKVICALIIDEMSIRQLVEWDKHKFAGYVDLGTDLDDDALPPAKEALTFMLNAINGNWKVPIGYFLINGLSALERANLITQALCLVHETGVDVVSVTCDGHSTNIATMNSLGANITADNLNHYFKHPKTGKPIYVILDPCHMLKLVRNALASTGSMIDPSGNFIKWQYITELEKKQKDEKLFISKIGTRHIQWYREKMKVKLAAQTLSRRVADALLYLKNDANKGKGMPEFKDCEPTANFLLIMNNLFDILNSRNLLSKDFKSPMKSENKDIFMQFFDMAEQYIRGLKTSITGEYILKSSRKTGFLGLLTCIKSFRSLYLDLCENSSSVMKFVLTYKFSQDHLEMFFSAIRSKGGFNNNPTAKQFKAAYVRLLVHHEIMTSDSANCLMLDDTSILNVSSAKNVFIRTINESSGNTDQIADFDNTESFYHDHDYRSNNPNFKTLSCYVNDVVEHIAGFVIKKLKTTLKCVTCFSALEDSCLVNRCRLIKRKNRGGLIIPSDDAITICKTGEKTFRIAQALGKLKTKNIMHTLLVHASREFAGSSIFNDLKDHCINQGPLDNHINILIKGILLEYFKIRLYHTGKLITENLQRNKVRQINSKITLFKGQ